MRNESRCSYCRLALFVACFLITGSLTAVERPNILWITSEDNGPQLGCYGDDYADTPHLDQLARRGMKFLNCWSNAPVCAPARTTLISGRWPTTMGAQHMRSLVTIPDELQLYPAHLQAAGYYCTNNSKEDYNVASSKQLWNESSGKAHWRKRPAATPFFAVFNFTTTHESQIRKRPHQAVHDPSQFKVPPFHPDLPEVRQDWAQYYDQISEMDAQVGQVLQQLEEDGLADDTIVFYYGDHGTGMPRGKRWLYQTGLHVPLIVHVPEKWRSLAGEAYRAEEDNAELVGFIDLAPTLLSLTGVDIPDSMQGRAVLGPQRQAAPEYMYAFRDRMDERVDMSRAVRDARYVYIRNFLPHRPQGQYLEYMFQTPTTRAWKQAFDQGKLNEAQSRFWQPKAPEELYDLATDPYQLNNLVASESHQPILTRMRQALRDWMIDARDLGLLPEALMHRRAGDDPPYTLGKDPQRFPVTELFDAADAASRADAADVPKLLSLATHRDDAIRYWGTVGLLLCGLSGESIPLNVLQQRMTEDNSSVVRSAAAEALARLGNAAQRNAAISQLVSEADQSRLTPYESIAALNSLAHCGLTPSKNWDASQPLAKDLLERLRSLPKESTDVPGRSDGYVGRLLDYFNSEWKGL